MPNSPNPNFPDDPDAKTGWKGTSAETRGAIESFATDYLSFVQSARTTRQSSHALLDMAKAAGAVALDSLDPSSETPPKPGQIFYWHDSAHGSIAMLKIGRAPVDEGLHVLLASHDSAVIRLTPNPIYEKSGLALFDTSIIGTLKLESWLHTPLALSLYRAPSPSGGPALELVLGDDPGEPVFTIPNLLPHLSRKVQKDKLIDSPERLDAVAGFTATAIQTTLKRNGVDPSALSGLQASLIPAGAPTFVGVDRALIAGANHVSRALPFAAMQALLEGEAKHSTLLILMGNDRSSYAGAGPESHITNLLPIAISALASDVDALRLRRILARTVVLLFDHSEGERNQGIVLGTRRDDSSPKAFRRAMQTFKAGHVETQLLQTAGWSQAREVASLDIDTIAIGLPISGVGMPYELLSTFDLYQARQACLAWVTQ